MPDKWGFEKNPDPYGDHENFDLGWQEPLNSCQLCGSMIVVSWRYCGRCDPTKDF